MRRVRRGPLGRATLDDLGRRQRLCANTGDARQRWKGYRGLAAAQPVVSELERMAGPRSRCFYCSDSRGTDIDHFVPIGVDYGQTFVWRNLLWLCAGCNRKKGDRPVEDGGRRILINPATDAPWRHLFLDVTTGVLAPKFADEDLDELGRRTLEVLDILNHEAVAEGRARSARRLLDAISRVAADPDSREAKQQLFAAVREDDYGIAEWLAAWEGRGEAACDALRTASQTIWRRFVCAAFAYQP